MAARSVRGRVTVVAEKEFAYFRASLARQRGRRSALKWLRNVACLRHRPSLYVTSY